MGSPLGVSKIGHTLTKVVMFFFERSFLCKHKAFVLIGLTVLNGRICSERMTEFKRACLHQIRFKYIATKYNVNNYTFYITISFNELEKSLKIILNNAWSSINRLIISPNFPTNNNIS
jgi:hypothetical protein